MMYKVPTMNETNECDTTILHGFKENSFRKAALVRSNLKKKIAKK